MPSRIVFWGPRYKEPFPKIELENDICDILQRESWRARQERLERAVILFGTVHNNIFQVCRIMDNDTCVENGLIWLRGAGELRYTLFIGRHLIPYLLPLEYVILSHAHEDTQIGIPSPRDCKGSQLRRSVDITFGLKYRKLVATGYLGENIVTVWSRNQRLTPDECKIKQIMFKQMREDEEDEKEETRKFRDRLAQFNRK